MKGAEERDLMFGKLFGYLSLIRSGKIENDKVNVLLIVDRLLELHNRKGWIREVVSESLLTLLSVIHPDVITLIIPKLKLLLGNGLINIADMTAWQLMLCVGIQQLATAPTDKSDKGDKGEKEKSEKVKLLMLQLLPQGDMVTSSSFAEMVPTLIEATAGFPKVTFPLFFLLSAHRVLYVSPLYQSSLPVPFIFIHPLPAITSYL